ncbi:MAG: hypothetical protein LKJ13_02335 [Clostridia bacterium]|jgi:hypothetical protein|nr:hypothetical protein [Clostridia bacterium]MCI2001142.1 hypothetical protein [Clostridia bacterium]MCI2015832.1 hypothetical protein [Clostridia bacterium]
MDTLLKKLSSRKLWACIAGVAVGVATSLGADSSTLQTISGAVISAVSLISYISAEAKIDAAGAGSEVDVDTIIKKVKELIENTSSAVDAIKKTDDNTDDTGKTNDAADTGKSTVNGHV